MYEDNMSEYTVKDSGNRRDFGTGAVRDMGAGKGRTDLLPFFALLELAKHFEAGAVKYGDENWRKGIPLRVYLDSAIRHLFKFALGMRDERHDLAALWNVACLIESQHMIDRGILPSALANLPDFHNRDDGGDAHALPFLTPEDIAGMPLAGALPGAYGCDDNGDPPFHMTVPPVGEDVKDLDTWLGLPDPKFTSGLNYGWVTDGPVPVRIVAHPLDLRPQDREIYHTHSEKVYTRGHADETATRFNAGQPYADLARLVVDEVDMDAVSPRLGQAVNDALADHTTPTEADTMNFIGFPRAVEYDDAVNAAEYDGPDADPLAGKAYVIVESPRDRGGSQWFLDGNGAVSFKFGPGSSCGASWFHTRDSIQQGTLAGRLVVVESGLLE